MIKVGQEYVAPASLQEHMAPLLRLQAFLEVLENVKCNGATAKNGKVVEIWRLAKC